VQQRRAGNPGRHEPPIKRLFGELDVAVQTLCAWLLFARQIIANIHKLRLLTALTKAPVFGFGRQRFGG
jgi:hypothetical protein